MRSLAATIARTVAMAAALSFAGCGGGPAPQDTGGCQCPDMCKCPHCKGEAGAAVCNCRSGGGHPGDASPSPSPSPSASPKNGK